MYTKSSSQNIVSKKSKFSIVKEKVRRKKEEVLKQKADRNKTLEQRQKELEKQLSNRPMSPSQKMIDNFSNFKQKNVSLNNPAAIPASSPLSMTKSAFEKYIKDNQKYL